MSTPHVPGALDRHTRLRVAVLAVCDPRTVTAYLRGASLRGVSAARISDALRSLGLEHHVRVARPMDEPATAFAVDTAPKTVA